MGRFRDFLLKVDGVVSSFDVRSYGYVVNRWLTNGAFFLLVVLLVVVASVDGVGALRGSVYMECPVEGNVDGRCANPFYDEMCGSVGLIGYPPSEVPPVVVCEPEYVSAGWSYGERPSWLARSFGWLSVVIVLSGLGLNHFLYNKDWRFEGEKK